MGTRINVLLDHDLADFRDTVEVLARLANTAVAVEAVRAYWHASDPDGSHDPQSVWEANPVFPQEAGLRRFTGPGSLFLSVTASAARVRTGGRWRGFLAIEPLRHVHFLAFWAIAQALRASVIAVYGDSDELDGMISDGRAPGECVEWMKQRWGPPQGSVEDLDPRIAAEAERCMPRGVWFLMGIKGGA